MTLPANSLVPLKSIRKAVALQILFLVSVAGQNCIPYGKRISLEGSLWVKDESGYNQFIVLQPARPICTMTDPKEGVDPGNEYYRGQKDVTEIQAGVYGNDAASNSLRDRLERLVGHRVMLSGDLFPATTGYHRTNVQFRVETADAVDAPGRQALHAPATKFRPKAVAAYDVTIHAARRLTIVARETASSALLVPGDRYAPHWMTGGDVVYVDCLDGYERTLIRTTDAEAGTCSDNDMCGFQAFPQKPITIIFRCVRKH